jgi:hypothetical protein
MRGALALALLLFIPTQANASLVIRIHKGGVRGVKTGQYVDVLRYGVLKNTFWASTGDPKRTQRNGKTGEKVQGEETPTGRFKVRSMHAQYRSRLLDVEMPYSVFFEGGFAIHATDNTNKLGKKASMGCVNLSLEDAKWLFEEIQKTGPDRVRIEVVESSPSGYPPHGEPPFLARTSVQESSPSCCGTSAQPELTEFANSTIRHLTKVSSKSDPARANRRDSKRKSELRSNRYSERAKEQ